MERIKFLNTYVDNMTYDNFIFYNSSNEILYVSVFLIKAGNPLILDNG